MQVITRVSFHCKCNFRRPLFCVNSYSILVLGRQTNITTKKNRNHREYIQNIYKAKNTPKINQINVVTIKKIESCTKTRVKSQRKAKPKLVFTRVQTIEEEKIQQTHTATKKKKYVKNS